MKKIIGGLIVLVICFFIVLPFADVNAADIINYGSETSYTSGAAADISITKLDATHVAIAYQDTADSSYGKVVYGVISGGNILTFPGSEVTFESSTTSNISVVAISSTEIAIAFTDSATGNSGNALYGVLSGNDFSFPGTKNSFSDSTTTNVSMVSLSGTEIAIAWTETDAGNSGTVLYGSKLGNGWDFPNIATPNGFSDSTTTNVSMVSLSGTEIAIAWTETDSGNSGTVLYGSKLGNGWDFPNIATPNGFSNSATANVSMVSLSGTEIAIAWTETGASNAGTALYGSKLGNGWDLPNVNTPPIFNSDTTSYISATALSDTDLAVAYFDAGANPGTGGIGIIGQFSEASESIPELPSNNLWKVLIAVLALGLVIGIAAFMKKKKK